MSSALRRIVSGFFLVALCAAAPAGSATTLPPPYDDLVRVPSRNFAAVYRLPGADFRRYTKVMIDPAEVSFRDGWVSSVNRSRRTWDRVSDSDAAEIAAAMRSGFEDVFADAFRRRGYEVVTAPGPDVLRLSPAIVDLEMNAPLPASSAARRTYAVEAGAATFGIQARDSTSGALLGFAMDRRATRSTGQLTVASGAANRAAFEDLFRRWADIAVTGFETLKSSAPPAAKK